MFYENARKSDLIQILSLTADSLGEWLFVTCLGMGFKLWPRVWSRRMNGVPTKTGPAGPVR
jgi:hypothetical protein